MNVDYVFVSVSMLFVILVSIQVTLNKIYTLLRDIKDELEDR